MFMGTITELGIALADLVTDQMEWSRETFGSDEVRGPMGSLLHLEKEACEAMLALKDFEVTKDGPFSLDEVAAAKAKFATEMADCLLVVLDASRRGGIKVMQLIEAAQAKMKVNAARMKVNAARAWPKPTGDGPVEHVREE